MILSVFSLFVLAFGAIIGLIMAGMHFYGKKSGKAVGVLHGAFTLSGVTMLLIAIAQLGRGWALWLGFAAVAAGGFYLFSRQLRGKPWPGFVIIAHGGLALVMLVTLGLWLGGALGEEGDPILPESPEPGEVRDMKNNANRDADPD